MAIEHTDRLGIETWSHGTDRHPPREIWDAQQRTLDDLVAIDRQYTTLSERPSAGVRGTYCWVEENGILYRDDGAQWRPIVQFGGGAGAGVVVGGSGAEGTSARTARADHSHPLPLATASAHGAMRKEDKAKLDAATAAAAASTLVQRDSAGGAAFSAVTASAAPSTAAHLTRRDYVDGLVGGVHVPTTIPSGANLDAYTTSGVYVQNQHSSAQAGTNYPVPYAGLLTVHAASAFVFQEYTATNLNPGHDRNSTWRRTRYNSSWSEWSQTPTASYVDAGDAAAASAAESALAPVRTTVNNATSAATASRLVLRDSAGRARFANPSNSADAATKGYADAGDAAAQSGAEATAAAALAPVKALTDTATSSATANALMRRDSSGRVSVGTPTSTAHAVTKGYVDAEAATRLPYGQSAGTGSIDSLLTPGHYHQASSAPVTTANGYPVNGSAGALSVLPFGTSANWVIQTFTEWTSRRTFTRATNSGATGWTAWTEWANTDTATSSAAGLMPAADKALLDTSTANNAPLSLVKRDSTGGAALGYVSLASNPSSTTHAARKSYVDAGDAAAQSAAEATAAAALSPVKALTDAATANATANALVRRDSAGRFKSATPSATTDVANKSYVDGKATTAQSNAEATAAAALSPVKTTVDNATDAATAGRLVLRDSAGRFKAAAPSATTDVANKSYVDAVDSKYASTKSTVDAATNINTPNTLVQRNATGSVQVNTLLLYGTPTGSNYAVPRSYVDDLVAPLVYDSGARYIDIEPANPVTGSPRGVFTLSRVGNMVILSIVGFSPSGTDTFLNQERNTGVTALPAGFRPAQNVVGVADRSGGYFTVRTNGQVWAKMPNRNTYSGTVMFPTPSAPPASFTWGTAV